MTGWTSSSFDDADYAAFVAEGGGTGRANLEAVSVVGQVNDGVGTRFNFDRVPAGQPAVVMAYDMSLY